MLKHHIVVNCDVVVAQLDTRTACEGILRDHTGMFIGGFKANIGQRSLLHAELLAILFEIKLAHSRGYSFIRIDSYSKNAIQLLDGNSSRQQHCYNLVEEIHVVYGSITNVSWNHVCKEALSLVSDYLIF